MKCVLFFAFLLHACRASASGHNEDERRQHVVMKQMLQKLNDLEDTVRKQQEQISNMEKKLRAGRNFRGLQEEVSTTPPESTTQEPSTQEPSTQAPTTQEPTTQEPTTQEPSTQEPITQEPTTQEPTTQEPTTQEATTQEPSTPPPEYATKEELEELRDTLRRRYALKRVFNIFKAEVQLCLPKCSRVYTVDSFKGDFSILDINTNRIVETVGQLHPDPERFTEPKGMAQKPNGDLLIWNKAPESDVGLARVDKRTGLATLIGTPQTNFVGGIAYFRGLLYGGGHRSVLSINENTGESVVICRLDNAISGMTAIPGDDKYLYAISAAGHRLIEIDPPASSMRSFEPCKANVIPMIGARELHSVGTFVWNRHTKKFVGSAWNEGAGPAADDEFLFDLSTDGTVSNIRAISTTDVVPGGMEFMD